MTTDETDVKVKERAYKIWEEEGRPEGRHDEHWSQAEKEFKSPERMTPEKTGSQDKKLKEAPAKITRETDKNSQAQKPYKSSKK